MEGSRRRKPHASPASGGAAVSGPDGLPFIVALNADKADPATRKFIRSHARRGRGRRVVADSRCSLGEDGSLDPVKPRDAIKLYTAPLISRFASELSFISFTDDVERSLVMSIAQVSPVAMKIMFPLIGRMGSNPDNGIWVNLVTYDAAALHVTVFAIEAFVDRVLRQQPSSISPTALVHFHKALNLLRERLTVYDEDTTISDATMLVVLKFACAAHFDGQFPASRQHLTGLRRMVDLRGGLASLGEDSLLFEILRCDLVVALLHDSPPVFYRPPSEPIPDYPSELIASFNDATHAHNTNYALDGIDPELASIWELMRKFCLVVNLGTQTQRLMKPNIVHKTMVAVLYRLLHLCVDVGSVDETIRLGLLAFSHHIFLQWQDIKPKNVPFLDMYRSCLLEFEVNADVSPQLELWLLMTGAISLFEISNEEWLGRLLKNSFQTNQINDWKQLQGVLKRFMWVHLLDDVEGKRVFDLIQGETRDTSSKGNSNTSSR